RYSAPNGLGFCVFFESGLQLFQRMSSGTIASSWISVGWIRQAGQEWLNKFGDIISVLLLYQAAFGQIFRLPGF
ncbi:hypothetical protein QLX67_14075, partial [Balneolaceae bacterium ANBcel3]|nr:hypothetical protein [Balneolaceae bacterium ANBcel3]